MANKQKILTSAQKLVQKGSYAKAIKEYERAAELDPDDLRVLLKLGEAKQKNGDIDGAVETYSRVAQQHASTGFLLKAAAVYKRILSLQTRNVHVHVRLAEVYHQLGLLSDAMSYYYAVANILQENADHTGYSDVLRRMALIEPDNVGIRIKLAEHYSRVEQIDEAVEEFSHAAGLLHKTGRLDDFVKVSERLIYHKPDALDQIKELVRVYLLQGDERRALAKIQLCTKVDPQDTETLELLVQTFAGLNQPDKAAQVLREKARIHEDRKEDAEAKAAWRRLLEFDPYDDDVRQHIGLAPVEGGLSQPSSVPEIMTQGPSTPSPVREPHKGSLLQPALPTAPLAVPPPLPPQALEAQGAELAQDDEIERLLTETDVYIKYGLVDRAFDHLRNVFLMDPNNLDAMERIKEMHFQAGYYPQAVDELLRMTKLAYHRDSERAMSYLREALQLLPDSEEVLKLAGSYGLSREDILPTKPPQKSDTADMPVSDTVDFMLAQLTAEVLDEDEAELGEIEVELDPEAIEMVRADLASVDEGEDDLVVMSKMGLLAQEIVSMQDDDPREMTVESLNVIDEDLQDIRAIQEGFGLSQNEVAQISMGLSLAEDDEQPHAPLTNEAQPLMEELFLSQAEDTSETYVPDDEDLERTQAWNEGLEEDEDMILIDDEDFIVPDDHKFSTLEVLPVNTPAPGKPTDTPAETGKVSAPGAQANQYSKHFQNHVATSTYVPFSDHGTLTEDDLSKNNEREDATCMIDIHEMQRKILEDREKSADTSEDLAEDLRLDIEESDFYLQQGLFEEARSTLDELSLQYPGHPLIAEKLKEINEEESAQRSVPAHNLPMPELVDLPALESAGSQGLSTHFELGLAYREMGLHEDSISEFQNAIDEGSQVGESHFLIGQSYIDQGQWRQAIAQFTYALEAKVSSPDLQTHAMYRLGLVHEAIGEGAQASDFYRRVSAHEELFPDLGQRIKNLGR